MQIINDVRQRAHQLLEENATTILTAGGVVGTVITAGLTGKASFTAAAIIESERLRMLGELREGTDYPEGETPMLPEPETKVKVSLVWPLFVPPVVTGVSTIAAIVFANRMSGQKAAALAAAYGISQKQLEEYKGKVAEKLGVNKTQKLEDELAQERVTGAGSTQIIVVDGEVLCYDQPTGRYFTSTMESINKAVNSTNAEILHHDHASASFFYEELGLPATTWTDEVGWNNDRLVELTISTVMSTDDKPCIAIDFKTLPKADYVPASY